MSKDISIQFHALPEELMSLTRPAVQGEGCYATAIKFHPFHARQIEPALLEAIFDDEAVRRIAFTTELPVLSASTMNEFLDHNPAALLLDIGRPSPQGLRESWLTARAQGAGLPSRWQDFAKRLRSMTRAGAVAVNPQTGASSRLKDHRFSAGAKQLESEGVPMLPAAGTSKITFEP